MSTEDVQRKYEEHLLQLPNVIGLAPGEKGGKPAIKVYVTHRVPESDLQPEDVIPKTLDGYQTDVEELGVVTAQIHPPPD